MVGTAVLAVGLLVGCLTAQQHASVSPGRKGVGGGGGGGGRRTGNGGVGNQGGWVREWEGEEPGGVQ